MKDSTNLDYDRAIRVDSFIFTVILSSAAAAVLFLLSWAWLGFNEPAPSGTSENFTVGLRYELWYMGYTFAGTGAIITGVLFALHLVLFRPWAKSILRRSASFNTP